MHIVRGAVIVTSVALMTACAVGPNYKRPPVDTAADYKEVNGWKPSEPADTLQRGPWWHIFNDDVLNALEDRIEISNQNVLAAAYAVEESRALVRQAQAGWPGCVLFNAVAHANHRGEWSHRGSGPGAGGPFTSTVNDIGLSANWNIDIWGQIRRTVEEAIATPAGDGSAQLASGVWPLGLSWATDYFELRAQDQLQVILNDIVVAEQQSLKITENRYKVGVAAWGGRRGERTDPAPFESGSTGECAPATRHSRTCDRRVGRPTAGDVFRGRRLTAHGCPDSPGWHAVSTARAPSRRGPGRTQDGVGQCADRRRYFGLFSQSDSGWLPTTMKPIRSAD